MIESVARYGRASALATGLLMAVATVFLLAFFAIEGQRVLEGGADTWVPLGRTNDALIGLSFLAAVPLAAYLHVGWLTRTPSLSAPLLFVGIAGMIILGLVQLIYAANLIKAEVHSPVAMVGHVCLGLWLIGVNAGRAHGALSGSVRWVGVAAGVGLLGIALSIALLGSATSNPQAAMSNPIAVGAGFLGILGTAILYPIWALALWRRLSIANSGTST
ncbi:MAG: hypothetical protein ACR2H0_08535 [Candidatus Limnocylindrales bacterium]